MMDPIGLPPSGYHPSPHPSAMSPDPPFDPSLPIDPAILEQARNPQSAPSLHPSCPPSPASAAPFRFEQGPQGDPFAPQQNNPFFHPPRLPSPPRPLKRKRKTRPVARRDEECSFCQGDDGHNKNDQPEEMVSCVACGRSGHPSCLDIQGIAEVLRSYPWHCIECKICEVCDKKGNGNRMLFCDSCDRGWHMDCLDPPLDSTPDGSWICPLCPCAPLPPQQESGLPHFPISASSPPSIASSSRSPYPIGQKTRQSALPSATRNDHDESDIDGNEPPRMRHKPEPVVSRGRGRPKGKGKAKASADIKGKGKARPLHAPEASSPTLKSTPRLRLSMRSRSRSVDPPAPTTRKVRLVVRRPRAVPDEDEDDADHDGSPSNMFEGVLKPEEYNTYHTRILDSDKSLFNRSRSRAELKLGPPVAPPLPQSAFLTPGPGTPSTSGPLAGPSTTSGLIHSLRTRHSLTHTLHHLNVSTDITPGTPNSTPPSNAAPLPPRIRTIRFGEYDVNTWYDAPFPEEYASVPDGKLWICEFCLKYMKSRFQSTRHRMKCKARHPPGDEIYRDGTISVFEVDGRKNKIYCQNLCLLSKMFLDHKSLFYDVEPFLFYVMTEVDRLGARFVGYFSKEKRSPKNYNVSCIMTLPVRQRKGWGNILIDFSYLLSKKEERVGSPERPLSALGALAYKQYWTHAIKLFLHTASEPVRLEDISRATSMTLEDIYNTLRDLNLITAQESTPAPPPRPPPGTPIKYLRGRKNGPGITRRGLARTNTKDESKAPLVIPTEYTVHWNREELDAYVTAWRAKEHVRIQPRCLKWSPFILSRARKSDNVGGPVEEANGVRESAGAAVTEVDRWSAGSTKVAQTAPHDVAVSTPKLPGESSPVEFPHTEEKTHHLAIEVEDSKPPVNSAASHDASQVAEDRAFAAELARMSEAPRRLRSTRSKSLREASVEEPSSTVSPSEPIRPRSLRSRNTTNNKRARNAEDEAQPELETSRDSALAAMLAREEGTRQTRSMAHRIDPQKISTPRSSPRKRQRVEWSPSAEPDADGSLSELTHGSTSLSPSPPPRRITRVNGRLKSQTQNGTNGTAQRSGVTRSAHIDVQPLISRNGPASLSSPAAKGIAGAEDVQRSTRQAKAYLVHEDNTDAGSKQTVSQHHWKDKSEQAEKRGDEAKNTVADGFPTSLMRSTEGINGEGLDSVTPGMYDEDALGEEDAEGEEDPNLSDC